MNYWIDEVIETEPEIPMDELNQETEQHFADKFEDVEEAWNDIVDRGYSQGSFRLPKGEEDELNCLGRALLTSMYGELSREAENISLNIYFDDKFAEDGTRKMQQPHVTTVIDGKEYGGEGTGDPENVPVSALPDLYRVGLGYLNLEYEDDFVTQLVDKDDLEGRRPEEVDEKELETTGYKKLAEWGSTIHARYHTENSGLNSDYLSVQGYLMEEGASEEKAKKTLGDDSDVFIA